jgi:hypothetical protein
MGSDRNRIEKEGRKLSDDKEKFCGIFKFLFVFYRSLSIFESICYPFFLIRIYLNTTIPPHLKTTTVKQSERFNTTSKLNRLNK